MKPEGCSYGTACQPQAGERLATGTFSHQKNSSQELEENSKAAKLPRLETAVSKNEEASKGFLTLGRSHNRTPSLLKSHRCETCHQNNQARCDTVGHLPKAKSRFLRRLSAYRYPEGPWQCVGVCWERQRVPPKHHMSHNLNS